MSFPPNFSFVIPGVLAGSSLPTIETAQHLVNENSIRTLVNLREEVYEPELASVFERGNVRMIHIPIEDFHAPTLEQMKQVRDLVRDETAWPIAMHCKAGIGRTGTMLAVGMASLFQSHPQLIEPLVDCTAPDQEELGERFIAALRLKRKGAVEVEAQRAAFLEFLKTI